MQNKIYDCVENSEIISCGIKPAEAKKFEELAAQQGTTASALIKAYVLQCLGKDQDAEPDQPEQGSRQEWNTVTIPYGYRVCTVFFTSCRYYQI